MKYKAVQLVLPGYEFLTDEWNEERKRKFFASLRAELDNETKKETRRKQRHESTRK